jgi:FkbM family methyltransferase
LSKKRKQIYQEIYHQLYNYAKNAWHKMPIHPLNRSWHSFSFKSYSQFGEDNVLRYFFLEKECTYIDIGSGHPIIGNNSYFLYKKKNNGILIDGIDINILRSKKLRPKDKSLNCLVGEKNENIKFYEFIDKNFSTVVDKTAEKFSKTLNEIPKVHELEIKTLDTILEGAYPSVPTLLNIDVEGNDLSVLKGIDWEKFHPRVICIEELDFSFEQTSEIQRYLAQRHYQLISRMVYSNIYLSKNYKSKFEWNQR